MVVRPLDEEDPLEEGMATHCSILAWRIPMDRGAWRATVPGVAKSRTRLKCHRCVPTMTPSDNQACHMTGQQKDSKTLEAGLERAALFLSFTEGSGGLKKSMSLAL